LSADTPTLREGQSVLVCVIDDDDLVRQTICGVLNNAGFSTVEASDGDIGLQVVRRSNPAVVVTDILMPNREGIETILLLKAEFPNIGVLAISGSYAPESALYLESAKTLGADDCLAKPFRADELVKRVTRLSSRPR
jgi:CheY-like chemotaxis protein